MVQTINQRAYERFAVEPMYTGVTVRPSGRRGPLEGHVYDVSVAGMRLELDEPLEPGETLAAEIALPGEPVPVRVRGAVVWVHDEHDDPGPKRLAVRFTRFGAESDEARLIRYLGDGWARRAA